MLSEKEILPLVSCFGLLGIIVTEYLRLGELCVSWFQRLVSPIANTDLKVSAGVQRGPSGYIIPRQKAERKKCKRKPNRYKQFYSQ